MEVKKVIKQDGEYICEIDVSINEWKEVLQDETLMTNNYKDVLLKFLAEPEHKSTCKALGEKYSVSPQSLNGTITNFAKAVQKKLNRFEVIGTDGTPSYWIIPMSGKYVGEHFEWTIRPELVEALNDIKYKWNNKMKYWHLQMCLPQGRGGLKIDSMDMLQNAPSVIGTGEWDSYQCKDFKETMRHGDIVCVKEGQQAIALCEVVGDNFNDQTLENQFLHHNYRTIKLLDTNPPDREFPQPQGTLSIARDKNTPSWKFINEWYNTYKRKHFMENYISLLKSNKNLVLTGAPGTGKTYLAKEIAKKIIGVKTDEELKEKEQFAFVQFHPSYDYTDFVEGLRPYSVEDEENIGFKRKDGIFKSFCKKALKAEISNEIDNFDEAWEELLSMVKANLANGTLTKIGSWEYGLSTKESLKYSSVNTPSQYNFTITKQNVYNAYKNIKARPSGAFQKDMEDVVEYMKQNQNLKDFQEGTISNETENNKYVFIIDEINRAEISKVFGELFFSIDPGYRGEKGKVKTQYANLQDADDVFADGFFVPENVYIIGTMNDIDRSVESMDFAMRRRFAWKEVKAEDRISMWDERIENWKDDAIKRMNSLNKAIEGIPSLSCAYHIGPAYFLKLENYQNEINPFDNLWNNHLEGVVFEYLRGLPDSEELMSKLKNAYNNLIDVEND